ncbi:MAG: hypothetical protein K6G07_06340 [Lachnospiraceae bacterium]|nr:hypothetical protein [Lachnospiraceae bacterium]
MQERKTEHTMRSEQKQRWAIRIILLVILLFLLGNLYLWNKVVSPAFLPGDGHSDLSAKACMSLPKGDGIQVTYEGHVMEMYEYMKLTNGGGDGKVDIVTIGNGFSQGGGGSFYQDYLMEHYGLKVLNITTEYDCSALEILNKLEGSYFMWVMMPRAVILQCDEDELSKYTGDLTDYSEYLKEEIEENVPIHIATDTFWNEQTAIEFWPKNMFLYNARFLKSKTATVFSGKDMGGKVVRAELNRDLFSAAGEENTLYYEEKKADPISEEDLNEINDNLNAAYAHYVPLYDLTLFLLPTPDKSDVYAPYIGAGESIEGSTEDSAFDRLSALPHDYTIIDTKRILQEELAKGNTDVYWPDSAYWSYKGYQPVMDEIVTILEQP